jgi:hypothetical protein
MDETDYNDGAYAQGLAGRTIEKGEQESSDEYFDRIYVGYWDGYNMNPGKFPFPYTHTIKMRNDFTQANYNNTLSLYRKTQYYDRSAVPMIDGKKKYTFSWLSTFIPDPRSVFFIWGKKYMCEKITAQFTEKGMSQLLKGVFYRISNGGSQIEPEPEPEPLYDAEVEYLSTDGTAYIDSGIKTTSDIRTVAKFSVTSRPSNNCAVFGGRVGYNDRGNTLYYYGNNSNIKFGWRYGNEEQNTGNGSWTGDYSISNLSAARTMVISGATSATLTASAASFSLEHNMYVFAMNNNGAVGGMNSASTAIKLKTIKFYNGGTLVRDYIAVRKNGVGYLYDKVSGELFGNAAASGSFVVGPDKT